VPNVQKHNIQMNITTHLSHYATTLEGAPTSDPCQTDVNKATESNNSSGGALRDTGCKSWK